MEAYQLTAYRYGTTIWIGPCAKHDKLIEKRYIHLDPLQYTSNARFLGRPCLNYVILNTMGKQSRVMGAPAAFDICFDRIMDVISDVIFAQTVLNSSKEEISLEVLKIVKNYQILPFVC